MAPSDHSNAHTHTHIVSLALFLFRPLTPQSFFVEKSNFDKVKGASEKQQKEKNIGRICLFETISEDNKESAEK